VLSAAPGVVVISGSPEFASESVVAYEVGSRFQVGASVLATVSTFYNEYDDIRTAEAGAGPGNLPIVFGNGVEGETYGVETTCALRVAPSWRVRFGHTLLRKELRIKPSSHDLNGGSAESDDPEHQAILHSSVDLGRALELDVILRYVDDLERTGVDRYLGTDLRVGWRVLHLLELSVVGQDLLEPRHQEFVPASPSPREVERSVLVKAVWQI
jgi:iron complex outermembrane receptor protein